MTNEMKVDVLAVMADHVTAICRNGGDPYAAGQARAAVAELIEAAKWAEREEYTRKSCVRLKAALARVGGA